MVGEGGRGVERGGRRAGVGEGFQTGRPMVRLGFRMVRRLEKERLSSGLRGDGWGLKGRQTLGGSIGDVLGVGEGRGVGGRRRRGGRGSSACGESGDEAGVEITGGKCAREGRCEVGKGDAFAGSGCDDVLQTEETRDVDAVGGVLLEAAGNQAIDVAGVASGARDARGGSGDDLREEGGLGAGLEGLLEGGELVEDAAETPDVGLVVVGALLGDFGGEVEGRAEGGVGAGLVGLEGAGHAEVPDTDGGLSREEDVGGLEVAVDDPLLVRVAHTVADAEEQLEPLADR